MEDENPHDPFPQTSGYCGLAPGEFAFDRQAAAMETAPHHEGPVCPMPQSTQEHGQQEVAIGLAFSVAIATQRNIEIITKPGAQTDVPAPPEILNAVGQVLLPEIHHKMKTHQLGTSAGDAAVPAEIAVNLPSESIGSEQHDRKARGTERSAKRSVGNEGAIIRNHALAEQAFQNQQQAVENLR